MASNDVIDTHGPVLSNVQSNVCLRVMARHPELCVLVLVIVITIFGRYGTSLQTKSITAPPKDPKRFFPTNSPVIDLPYGNLEPVVNILHNEQFIFVMYYAPWCAKSMSLRWEFQKAAKFMQNQVKFIGINCWWPQGSCRKRYKFMMFPVLYAYFSNLDGYRYLGSSSAEYMVKFLEDLIYPLSLVHSVNEVTDHVAENDMAVLAYFDFNSSPQPPGYLQYYYASMRSVEHDPYQILKYSVISTPSLAAVYSLNNISEIVLLRSANTTLKYPIEANYTSSSIVKWVLQNRQKPAVKMITPLGVKSLTLSRQVSLGPSLILFTPINQLFDINIYLHMLKYLSLEFSNNCDKNITYDSGSMIESWKSYSVQTMNRYHSVIKMCEQYTQQKYPQTFDHKCCVTIVNTSESKNVCEFCQHRMSLGSMPFAPMSCAINFNSGILSLPKLDHSLSVNACVSSQDTYNGYEHSSITCNMCPKYEQRIKSEKIRRRTDRYVYQNLEILPLRLCKRLTLQKIQDIPSAPVYPEFEIPESFSGLSCKQNKSLNFYAIDSLHHSLFAKRLGVNIDKLREHPATVIIDKDVEEHYILKENFTTTNVATFIVNYTKGKLRRKLVTHQPIISSCSQRDLCVTELTSQTFHQTIHKPSQDVVVLVYSLWCGYCTSVNHLYLSLKKYFRFNQNIRFTRIDGDLNDLPWEYTVDNYPSIMFFPANRQADSVVFPLSVPITLTNLIKFIFQHSTYRLRTETAVSICNRQCIQRNAEYAQRMSYVLTQRLKRLQTRFTFITRVSNQYVNHAVTILNQKISKLVKQLNKVQKLQNYLQISKHEIHYSKIAQFLRS